MKIRLADKIVFDSIVDGEGLRAVIYTQGCKHGCKECHNPQTWDFTKGILVEADEVIEEIAGNILNPYVTFSGGDPFEQPEACRYILLKLKELGKENFWSYTGYLWEELTDKNSKHYTKERYEFLKELDVLVDGRFDINLKSYDLNYKGSANQRVIDVQRSLKEGKVILKYE